MGWDWSLLWTAWCQMVIDRSYLCSVCSIGIKWSATGPSSRADAVRQFIIGPSCGVFGVRNVTTCSERTAFCFSVHLVCCSYSNIHTFCRSRSPSPSLCACVCYSEDKLHSIKACVSAALAEISPRQLAITFAHLHLSLACVFRSTSIARSTLFSHKQSC